MCRYSRSGAESHRDHTRLLAALSSEIDAVLSSLLAPGTPVALVNFPNHNNPGDSAIWLGEKRALRRARVSLRYQASWSSYDRRTLARRLPEGVILLNGGGNFGDLYQGQQQVRERILEDFAGRPLVQLPQSIFFEGSSNLERMRRLCEGHGNLTLLVRERQSLAFAREHFDVPVRLCPDMALALGPLARPAESSVDLLWIVRRDRESTSYDTPADAAGLLVTDWIEPLTGEPRPGIDTRWAASLNRALIQNGVAGLRAMGWIWRALAKTFDPMAEYWVGRGLWLLCQGRVVICDRLHGHILALLLGIPHVVMDNSYGKVRGFYQTHTRDSPLAHWAATPEEALAVAYDLTRGT